MQINIFRAAIQAIANWRDSISRSSKEAHSNTLRNSFYLQERNGSVFLLHDGVAVAEFSPCENADEIINQLEDMREIAVRFEYEEA